jgi:hypothetical protein
MWSVVGVVAQVAGLRQLVAAALGEHARGFRRIAHRVLQRIVGFRASRTSADASRRWPRASSRITWRLRRASVKGRVDHRVALQRRLAGAAGRSSRSDRARFALGRDPGDGEVDPARRICRRRAASWFSGTDNVAHCASTDCSGELNAQGLKASCPYFSACGWRRLVVAAGLSGAACECAVAQLAITEDAGDQRQL